MHRVRQHGKWTRLAVERRDTVEELEVEAVAVLVVVVAEQATGRPFRWELRELRRVGRPAVERRVVERRTLREPREVRVRTDQRRNSRPRRKQRSVSGIVIETTYARQLQRPRKRTTITSRFDDRIQVKSPSQSTSHLQVDGRPRSRWWNLLTRNRSHRSMPTRRDTLRRDRPSTREVASTRKLRNVRP